MKRRSLTPGLLLSALAGLALVATAARAGTYGGGTGEPNDPFLIYDANQMNAIGANPSDLDKHFRLMNDIDLAGVQFSMIGSDATPFAGCFDGNEHTIMNFTYIADNFFCGLFRKVVGEYARIENLILKDPNVEAPAYNSIATLVAVLDRGTVSNCRVEGGNVRGRQAVGGLVAQNLQGTISNCSSSLSVSGPDATSDLLGGLVGLNTGVITNCYSSATVTSVGDTWLWAGSGGLVGANEEGGVISNSYASGDVVRDSTKVGGLVGHNRATIANCYATGNATGLSIVGGLVGLNAGSGAITNCYSVGRVDGDESVGGLVGTSEGGSAVTNSFWDYQTSGQFSSAGGDGRPTATLYSVSTFTNAGWNFSVWHICNTLYYPKLSWQQGPLVGFAPPELRFDAVQGGTNPAAKIASVCNCGSGTLHWEAREDCNWLSVEPNSGSLSACTSQAILVSVDITALPKGNYYIQLTVSDPCAQNSPEKVGVWLTVVQYGGGSGTPEDPYLVYTEEQMNFVGANPSNWDKHFKLMADIDLGEYTGRQFNIIGGGLPWQWAHGYNPFSGTFYGNGHCISNFSYETAGFEPVGLFGLIRGASAEIKDLALSNPQVLASNPDARYLGALVGEVQEATIYNCHVDGGSVSGHGEVGALVGESSGSVVNCSASASVSGSFAVGGLVGANMARDVNDHGLVSSCSASGLVSGMWDIGGLVGLNWGYVRDSYARGGVEGFGRSIGGLVGQNVHIRDLPEVVTGRISRSYSTGPVSGPDDTGGLVGAVYWDGATISGSFWDEQTSGQTDMCGQEYDGASTCDDSCGKTTAQMKTQATFTAAGWDFNTPVWKICEGTCYPSLWYQYEQPILGVSPAQLQFAALEGYPNPEGQILSVGNCGTGTLTWQMDEECSWLAVEPNSGTVGLFESEDVNVICASSSLSKGNYYCELTFSDACDPNVTVIVPVDLTVTGPKLSVVPTSLEFIAAPDEPNVGGQILTIRNTGGGTLNWEITGANDCNWLGVYPLTGQSRGEVNEVTITVDPCNLALGFYNCQLVVSDPNAAGSPKNVNVTLHIRIPGELHVPVEYSTIQSALNAAVAGETVILQPGSYDESINIPARDITVTSTDPHDPDIVADTILDGAGYRSAVAFSAGAGSPILTGFTITNGTNGISAEAANPIITRCTIRDNLGHGIRCSDSDPTVIDCNITDNDGAGISLYSVEQNTAVVINCRLLANGLDGVSCHNTDLDITNCLIAGNGGNGFWAYSSLLLNITNCTIVENAELGFSAEECRTTVANSIICDNALGQIYEDYGILRLSYSDVEGGWPGIAVIDAEPNFAAPGGWVDVNDPNITVEPNDPNALWLEGDYHLLAASACIDHGNNASLPDDVADLDGDANTVEPLPLDLDYLPRIIDGDCNATDVVDMGAYEAGCACTGDFDADCDVGLGDYAMLASAWFAAEGQPSYNPACDVALPPDGFIDWKDLGVLTENWLQGL